MRSKIGPIESLDLFAASSGAPLLLALDAIDEDPSQPRVEYEPVALQELAETIKQRGVRQPVSVRPHPDEPGRWMLNFGSRRLRASRLAGVTQIPAFVDGTTDSYDQVIENEQREGLRPLELALFVQRRLQAGDSRAEIARRMGKSGPYITFACALIDAPDWLMTLYRGGRCTGLLELYEMRRLHDIYPVQVERFASALAFIGRADVERLKLELGQARNGMGSSTGESVVAPSQTSAGALGDGREAAPFGSPAALNSSSLGDVAAQPTSSTHGPASAGPSQVVDLLPLSGDSEADLTTTHASHLSANLGPASQLADAQHAASVALQTLVRAMAAMRAEAPAGDEALRKLRARLVELATAESFAG